MCERSPKRKVSFFSSSFKQENWRNSFNLTLNMFERDHFFLWNINFVNSSTSVHTIHMYLYFDTKCNSKKKKKNCTRTCRNYQALKLRERQINDLNKKQHCRKKKQFSCRQTTFTIVAFKWGGECCPRDLFLIVCSRWDTERWRPPKRCLGYKAAARTILTPHVFITLANVITLQIDVCSVVFCPVFVHLNSHIFAHYVCIRGYVVQMAKRTNTITRTMSKQILPNTKDKWTLDVGH